MAHYKTRGEEIWKQTNDKIDYSVSSLGTLGTIIGRGAGIKKAQPKNQAGLRPSRSGAAMYAILENAKR